MARFLEHLEKAGTSPRTISGMTADLQALGLLTFYYDSPKPSEVLEGLSPDAYDYRRKFSDSPGAVSRYERTVQRFRGFLVEQGLVNPDEDE